MNKKLSLLMLLFGFAQARKTGPVIKIGGNSSLLVENGNAYPVVGISVGIYPVKFFSIEGSGEYVFKSDYKEVNLPLSCNFYAPMKVFTPYAGLGMVYNTKICDNYSKSSLGGRAKLGAKIIDSKGTTASIEANYDLPDWRGARGRWIITGRIDQNFEIAF